MKKWTEAITEKQNSLKDSDIILGLSLVNPSLLNFTTDPRNQYLFTDHTFHNLLKHTNIHFSSKVNWNIPNPINDIDISVEKDWSKLKNIRNRTIELLNTHPAIDKVTFNETGMLVNDDTYMHNKSKTYGTNAIFDILFGVDQQLIYQQQYLWDKLIQNWMKLVFAHAKPEQKNVIENFIFDNQIADLTFEEYKKIAANDEYKFLGVYYPQSKKNFKKLSDLLKYLIKDSKNWHHFRAMKTSWQNLKNNILNKIILLPIFKDKIESQHLKNGVLHYLADHFDLKDDSYTNIKTLKKLPTRNQLLKKDVDLAISFWNNKNFDFVYLIKCLEDEKELGSIEIEIGWPSGIPENKLNAKIRLNKLNIENLVK